MVRKILHIGGVVIALGAAVAMIVSGAVNHHPSLWIIGIAAALSVAVAIFDGATAGVRLSRTPVLHPEARFQGLSDGATWLILGIMALGLAIAGVVSLV